MSATTRRCLTTLAAIVALLVAGVVCSREPARTHGPNSALTLVDQVTIPGYTRLVFGVTVDDPPTAYAQYFGDPDAQLLEHFQAPGIQLVPRTDPLGDDYSRMIALGEAPNGCELLLLQFLPTPSPLARAHLTSAQTTDFLHGTRVKLQVRTECPS
ncbi:hypothetical protein [Nocardia sp. NBC_00511]|uniref:hypothetical protein n=1 Tax=Nocardia sp. NBC_00511 TaxID=2903591 RepID=UPI0030E5CF54